MKEAREARKMENSPSSPKDFTLILWNFHRWTKLLRFTLLEVQVSWDWVAVHWQSCSFPELIILLHPPLTLVNQIIKSMQLCTGCILAGRTQIQTEGPSFQFWVTKLLSLSIDSSSWLKKSVWRHVRDNLTCRKTMSFKQI